MFNSIAHLHASQLVTVLCVAAIIYTYAGYPVLLFCLAMFRAKRVPKSNYFPSVSILIAAYNEEKNILRKIQETLLLDYPADKLEIIVLSDASSDGTDDIVRAISNPRVRLLRIPQRHGKTHAQNQGVKIANGEILVFSDATTVYHPSALKYLVSNFQDPTVGAATGRNRYYDPANSSPTGMGTTTFWNYENVIKTLQSRVYSLSGCVGCIYAVRKSAFTELADDVISDFVEPLWVLQKGLRVVFEDRAVAYEHTTDSTAREFSMRVRVVTRGMRGLLSVRQILNPLRYPWISFQLISHKVLRWLVPVFLGVMLVASTVGSAHLVLRYFVGFQFAFYASALLGLWTPLHRAWKPLAVPLYFCTLNAAAFVSLFELLRGRKYVVWDTQRVASRNASALAKAPRPLERESA